MIEITHQQARQLARDSLDAGKAPGGRLTQEQWAALQEHLEACEECRQYVQRLQLLERDLSRMLQARLNAASGPQPGLFHAVVDRRQAEKENRRRWSHALAVIAGVVALAAFLKLHPVLFPAATPIAPVNTPAALASPTLKPTPRGAFRGLLAFESRHEGNAEIYLLNAGPEATDLTNLTASPAQDTFPAWSPDGEWMAFLSDRDGKNEVYVISIAGSRVTRLTADPRLEWRGPLSWSPDGRWIAARAARLEQGGEVYVYLVSLDGRIPPRSVAHSRGSPGAPVFSPTNNYLAFQAALPVGLIYDYSLYTGWYSAFNSHEVSTSHIRSTGVYDWMAGGTNLVYIAEGPYPGGKATPVSSSLLSLVNVSPGITESNTAPVSEASPWTIASAPGAGAFRAAAVGPGGITFVYSQDEDGDGCWTLHLQRLFQPLPKPVEVAGICFEGRLARTSWQPVSQTSETAWVVGLARRLGESAPVFLAVRLTQNLNDVLSSPLTPPAEMIGVPGLATSADPATWPGDPFPRPDGRPLGINPVAAVAVELPAPSSTPAPSSPPAADVAKHLVVERVAVSGTSLAAVQPGGEMQTLVGEERSPSCPSLSPDGSRVAYLAHPDGPDGEVQVEVAPSGGGEVLRLTGPGAAAGNPPGSGVFHPYYGCPVWSPDGTLLAVEYRSAKYTYLAILSADDGAEAGYLRIEPQSVPPVWTRSGEENGPLLLAYPQALANPPRIVSLDLNSPHNRQALRLSMEAETQTLVELNGIDAVAAFTASPSGQRIALVGIIYYSRQSKAILSASFITGDRNVLLHFPLEGYDPGLAGPRSLAWLDGNRVGLFQPLPLNGEVKAYLKLYGSHSGVMAQVASFNDLVSGVAWARDASRVYIASESGLWAQDVLAGLLEGSPPLRIAADWVNAVDLQQAGK